VCDIIIDDNN